MEEVIEEGKEKKKKHKHKKKKKHRHEEKEELLEIKETNLDQKLNTINLPPNIPSEPLKPSPPPLFEKKVNSERGLLPKFKVPEDSDTGTDNALQGVRKPSSRLSGLSEIKDSGEISPRTRSWRPRVKEDTSDDEKYRYHKSPQPPGRARFSNEIVDIEDLSSDGETQQPQRSHRSTSRARFSKELDVSSDDSEENSRRSFQKLKKKKHKKRTLRNLSDSDDI